MSVSTGLYRLAQVIKGGGRVLTVLCLIALFIGEPSFTEKVFLLLGIFFVVVTEVIAWVLEGFADE